MLKLILRLLKVSIAIYLLVQGIIWLRNPDLQVMAAIAIYWVGGILLCWMPDRE